MLKNINPLGTAAWKKLEQHFEGVKDIRMQNLFVEDTLRAGRYSIHWDSFLVDYSKNKVTEETMALLNNLANEAELSSAIELMFSGARINKTEDRAVLHTALRCFDTNNSLVGDSSFLFEEVRITRERMYQFIDAVLGGNYVSSSGKKFTDVVNIGIGGSDLGPRMVVDALGNYQIGLQAHYISNIDPDYVNLVLNKLDPETTLVLVISKTFTTQETILNANRAKQWLVSSLGMASCDKHLVGVTANIDEAVRFGVNQENIFPMWDSIGGRFSLWSAVGLSIGLSIGSSNFEALLKGAYKMDKHFKETPFDKNIPVVLALLSIWYNNFFGYESEVVVPYSQFLERFPAHLQQMIMESNGKTTDRNGKRVHYETGNLIWGEVGVNAQHAFFQLFHQGTKIAPIDFIGFVKPFSGFSESHEALISNFFGQSEALMNGKCTNPSIDVLEEFKQFEGNKPSTTILIDALTPESLGQLVAMYEHKTFVQGIIWNIYSFDQFGVEYGKVLAKNIQREIAEDNVANHDCSTSFLVNYYINKSKS